MVAREDVMRALSTIRDPDLGRDVVSLGMVKDLDIQGGRVAFTMELTTPACPVKAHFETAAKDAVMAIAGVDDVQVSMTSNVRPSNQMAGTLVPGVKNMVAIASGKGGVGKSTVSANLAVALAAEGARVGLLDADIYGATIPSVMGTSDRPALDEATEKLLPVRAHGVELISISLLLKSSQEALVWRGPIVAKTLTQLLGDVEWGELDYLLIDLPPGTGDVPLTLAQAVPLTGVAVVCTPQRMAVDIAVKSVLMFRQLNVNVLGLIENMSYYDCECGRRHHPFSTGGAEAKSKELGIPFLGALPLDDEIREGADAGRPAAAVAGSPQQAAFQELSRKLAAQISVRAFRRLPVIQVR
ncbi:MAG TPA: Mrp/NBP35 family ATP-binding protein [Candidatus Dormibacteraeota bacterium]|nr:Mrp/NBP35 family ATP-binding protein [Candidatus Dormibacteraeota bacterium]